MSVTITKRPEITQAGITYRWLSVVHPIIFEMQSEVLDETARPNYRVKIGILDVEQGRVTARKVVKPAANGFVRVDLQEYLKQFLSPADTAISGINNKVDLGKALRFRIVLQEQNDLTGESLETVDELDYFATLAKVQIGEGSQILTDYVMSRQERPGKFLTKFKVPVAFEGWPFSLSFAYDSSLEGIEVFKYDDGVKVALNRQAGRIHQLYLKGGYGNARSVDVHLETGELL